MGLKIKFTNLFLLSILVLCACAPKTENKAVWSVIPMIVTNTGSRQSMRELLTERSSTLDLSDRIQFTLPTFPFRLEVTTTCQIPGEASATHTWTGRVAPDVEVPVLQLVPRRVIFHRGESLIGKSSCRFDFFARSDSADLHRFSLGNRTIVGEGPFENRISLLEQQTVIERTERSYELKCDHFQWTFTRVLEAGVEPSALAQWVETNIDQPERLARRPRQNCRVFELIGNSTRAVSPLIRLQFTPPNLEVHRITTPTEGEINNHTTNPAQFQWLLARFVLHNKNPFPVRVRLPQSPQTGLVVTTLLPNHNHSSPEGISYNAVLGAQVGYITTVQEGSRILRQGRHFDLELSPWERTTIEVSTAFAYHCPSRQFLTRMQLPRSLELGYVPPDESQNEALPDFNWQLPTTNPQWVANFRLARKPTAAELNRLRPVRCSVASTLQR